MYSCEVLPQPPHSSDLASSDYIQPVHDLEISHDVMALQGGHETVCMQLLNNETDSTTAAHSCS
jgi:hypothetical protein